MEKIKVLKNFFFIVLTLIIALEPAANVMGQQESITLTTIMPGQDTLRVKRGGVGVNYRDSSKYSDADIGDDNLIIEGKVGIGTPTPDPAAALEISSTDSAFLPPRMTTTQRDNISNPIKGSIIYNTSSGSEEGLNHYDGSNWKVVGSPSGVFGVWDDRDKDGLAETFTYGTTYTAQTDGIVVAVSRNTTGSTTVAGYTNGVVVAEEIMQIAGAKVTTTFPVKKGHTWQITFNYTGSSGIVIKWLPMGN